MKNMGYYEYTIGAHFLPALINDDLTGLEDDELSDFQAWIDSLPVTPSPWFFDVVDYGNNFAKCEITGLRGDCATVRQYFDARG